MMLLIFAKKHFMLHGTHIGILVLRISLLPQWMRASHEF